MKRTWSFNPHAGGKSIPPSVQERTRRRILAYAEAHYSGRFTGLKILFRGKFCYIDAYTEPEAPTTKDLAMRGETLGEYQERLRAFPIHLCRLRYFDEDRWSLAFCTYSNEKYEPSVFDRGEFFGTPEQGLDVGAIYLR